MNKLKELDDDILIDEVCKRIKNNPNLYPYVVSRSAYAFQEYKKELDRIQAETLLIINLVSKRSKKRILGKLNQELIHPEIIKNLKTDE